MQWPREKNARANNALQHYTDTYRLSNDENPINKSGMNSGAQTA